MERYNSHKQGLCTGNFRNERDEQIAKFLDEKGIDYKYQYPIAVRNCGQTEIWDTDFFLPEYGIIIECVGMDNQQRNHDIAIYQKNNVDGVFLTGDFPDASLCFNHILSEIERILDFRTRWFRAKVINNFQLGKERFKMLLYDHYY